MSNYSLTFKKDPQEYISTDDFRPFKQMDLKLKIFLVPQHDGRCWSEVELRGTSGKLIEEVMGELRVAVTNLVAEVDPYGIHC